MNDVNQIRIPQNKIIAETKIRKEIDNLYQINQTEITDYDVSTINKFLPSRNIILINQKQIESIKMNILY
jgi:hypothetical protein